MKIGKAVPADNSVILIRAELSQKLKNPKKEGTWALNITKFKYEKAWEEYFALLINLGKDT